MKDRDYDPHDLKGQDRVKRDQQAKDDLKRKQFADDFKWLMEDVRGRRLMWRLLEETGVFRSSFTGNSETFFREGERNIGLRYINHLHGLCPEAYLQMIKDHQQ